MAPNHMQEARRQDIDYISELSSSDEQCLDTSHRMCDVIGGGARLQQDPDTPGAPQHRRLPQGKPLKDPMTLAAVGQLEKHR